MGMAVLRAVRYLIVGLAGASLLEIGFLWGSAGDRAEPAVLFCPAREDAAVADRPVGELVPPAVAAADPAPQRPAPAGARPAPRRRKPPPAPILTDVRALEECAREGGPLCGIPR